MKDIYIEKKNRKFFAIKVGDYSAKLVIDEVSENLEVGHHNLDLEDVSIRSKYGTDLRFKMRGKVESYCFYKPVDFNSVAATKCRELGGSWDKEAACWAFPSYIEEQVDELEKYNDLVAVEVIAGETCFAHNGPLILGGKQIAKATSRDSGASTSEGVSIISGGVVSGGSMKNWGTEATENTVIRMKIPRFFAESFEADSCFKSVEII